ncbi:MAG: glycosyltransferase [Steroidobacter sp.]
MLEVIFVHLLNDESGSARVLRDLIESPCFATTDNLLVTNQSSGFLSGIAVRYCRIFYEYRKSKIITAVFLMLAQIQLFIIVTFRILMRKVSGKRTIVVINTLLPIGAAISAKLFSNYTIYYVHETSIRPLWYKRVLRNVVERCADEVIFVSNYLQSVECFPKLRSHVIHNGLRGDFDAMPVIDKTKKFSNGIVVFVGSLKGYKGIYQLMEIARVCPDIRFAAIFNCSHTELSQFRSRVKFPDNLEVIVRPKDILRYFRDSLIVLNLSIPDKWIETFGLTLLEGMSYGCAVVAPPVGGHLDFVGAEHGLIIDSRNTVAIVEFLKAIRSSFNMWESFSDAAVKTAEKYSSAAFQKRVSEVFLPVIERLR